MIEKTAQLLSRINPGPGITRTALSNPKGSSFRDLLDQELSFSRPIEPIILNYLIKTILSILAKQNPEEPLSSFPGHSVGVDGPFLPRPADQQSVFKVQPSSGVGKSGTQKIDEIIRSAADQYGVDPALVKAVIDTESAGNPLAVSPAGAQGLMQLMPRTAAELGVTNPFDPAQNITAGTRYLRQLLDRYQGNIRLTLGAYNWGMGNLERNPAGLPRETRNYIARVERQYRAHLSSSSA